MQVKPNSRTQHIILWLLYPAAMKRPHISVLCIACLVMLVVKASVQDHKSLYRGPDRSHANFIKHPRVFLDVSPMAIKKVLDALYCALQCLRNARCLSFNVKIKPDAYNKYDCRLLATDKYSPDNMKSSKEFDYYIIPNPCESSPCQNGGTCWPAHENRRQCKSECAAAFTGIHCEHVFRGKSCGDFLKKSQATDGVYEILVHEQMFKVYCDMTNDKKAWTLIARFSNNDTKEWMKNSGKYWYDQNSAVGQTTNPADNTDMISPAFWSVNGTEFKITRNDDSNHTALLHTTGECLGGQTFRSKMTSYGDFRNSKVWASDECLGNCDVLYGGQYENTEGFRAAKCDGDIQQKNKIGFWCDHAINGAVLTIGGAGGSCHAAAHGIGITGADEASFVHDQHQDFKAGEDEYDFGNNPWQYTNMPLYSLNLWVR